MNEVRFMSTSRFCARRVGGGQYNAAAWLFPPACSSAWYRIVSPLGAGGMGEVFSAHDTRLNRDVAIKIAARRARRRPRTRGNDSNAKRATISSLNHPNICALSTTLAPGRQIDFLVMELLDGESLQQRLREGPLPLDQALRVRHRRSPTR